MNAADAATFARLIGTHLAVRLEHAGITGWEVPDRPTVEDIAFGCRLLGVLPSQIVAEVEHMRGQ